MEDAAYGIDQICSVIQEQASYSRFSASFAKAYLHLKLTHDYIPMDKLYYKKPLTTSAREILRCPSVVIITVTPM